jgi:hypothetical protein
MGSRYSFSRQPHEAKKNQETMMMDDVDQVNPPLAFPLS